MQLAVLSASLASTFSLATPAQTPQSTEPAPIPAALAWGDYDADGKLDAVAVLPTGQVVLLHNRGDGAFDDRTTLVGLSKAHAATLAAWQDVDGDGLVDLFLGGAGDAPRLWRNAGRT